jgi:adenylate cyclase
MPRWLRGLLIGIATGACGAALVVTTLGTWFEETVGLPWLFQVRGPIAPPADVVVVAIDGSTGRRLDLPRLPRDWPRTVHAQLVESLVERGAAVIVFDMDFSRVKSGYEDLVFAKAILNSDRVVLFERLEGRRQPVARADGTSGGWTWVEEKLPPAPSLALAARALGPFPLPKLGKTAFQFWVFKSSAGNAPTTAALALQLYALGAYERWLEVLKQAGAPGTEDLPARAEEIAKSYDLPDLMNTLRDGFERDPQLRQRIHRIAAQIEAAQEDGTTTPLITALAALYDGSSNRYLNLYGPPGTIRTIPYHSLVGQYPANAGGTSAEEARPPEADLAGKVVFVGYSDLYEPDQPDRFYTVFTGRDGIDLSGVEIMATAFANLLRDDALRQSGSEIAAVLVLGFGFAVGAGIYLLPAMLGVPLAVAFAALYWAAVQWAFNETQLWLPVATPILVQLPIALFVGLMGQYLLKRRQEQQMTRAISYYLPKEIIRDLTAGGVNPDSVNKVVYATCLATDMSGFSTIAENMSPKELATFMNAYFDALSQSLKRHAVDVTEFHADTIMCAWTAPEPSAQARRNAALAGIDVIQAIQDFSAEHGSLRLNPRIGLQDGSIYLGHTGGGGRLAYSILGDAANTAARLESFNKQLGTHVLAAATVVQNLDDVLVFRPLGSFQFVGKADAIPVVELLSRRAIATSGQRRLCERFSEALELFRAQRWVDAANLLEAIIETFPHDGPSRLYLDRCRRYAAEGPGDADPTVIHLDTK